MFCAIWFNYSCIKETVSIICILFQLIGILWKKMLQDPKALENIITAASGLDDDPVAIELVFWARYFKMTML